MSNNLTGTTEHLETDLTTWRIGPYHGALPGPMSMELKLDGEIISSGTVETGFLHRGLEKAIELHPWHASVAYADRLDPEGAIFGELALCLAVEEIGQIEVPARAQAVRVIAAELTRVSAHFSFISRIAHSTGSDTMLHYVLRDRERILDLFELLAGARFSLNFLRFGGVAADVTEGFMERVLEACHLIRIRLKEYNDLLSSNRAFLKRTVGIGTLDAATVARCGITGPNARASGVRQDVRLDHPYSGYERLDLGRATPIADEGAQGDCNRRYLIRLREIDQSLEILKQVVEAMPMGPFASGPSPQKDFTLKAGEAYSRIESARGILGCYVVSDGGTKPARVQFRVPSQATLMAVPDLVVGSRLEDLPVILSSLDIGITEVDR